MPVINRARRPNRTSQVRLPRAAQFHGQHHLSRVRQRRPHGARLPRPPARHQLAQRRSRRPARTPRPRRQSRRSRPRVRVAHAGALWRSSLRRGPAASHRGRLRRRVRRRRCGIVEPPAMAAAPRRRRWRQQRVDAVGKAPRRARRWNGWRSGPAVGRRARRRSGPIWRLRRCSGRVRSGPAPAAARQPELCRLRLLGLCWPSRCLRSLGCSTTATTWNAGLFRGRCGCTPAASASFGRCASTGMETCPLPLIQVLTCCSLPWTSLLLPRRACRVGWCEKANLRLTTQIEIGECLVGVV